MSSNVTVNRTHRYIMMFGAFIIGLPMGVPWYYGNLSPYLISYYRYGIGPKAFNMDTEWLLSIFLVLAAAGLLTADYLVNKFGIRLVHMAAFLTFDLGMFLTCFTVQHSVGLTAITLTAICGYTTGLVTVVCLMFVSRTMQNHVAVTSALVSSGFGLGAIFFNILVTAYINPDNLIPDVRQKDMAFFSQSRVINNVPGVFIVIGAVSLGVHILGFLLEQLPPALMRAKDTCISSIVCGKAQVEKSSNKEYKTIHQLHQVHNNETTSNGEGLGSPDSKEDVPKDIPQAVSHEDASLKPCEVLRTRSFYQIWISLTILSYSGLVTQNFYKLFGQLWIKDDSFLTSVGSVATVTMSLFRVAVGSIIDRAGVKNTLILALSMNAVLMSFWYITPRVDRWFYFVFFQIINGIHGSVFILIPMAALKLFGPRYYATNYGLIMTALLVNNLVSPTLFPILLDKTGWFGLIFVGAAGSVFVLVSLILIMPSEL